MKKIGKIVLLSVMSLLLFSGCASDVVVDSYIYLSLPANSTTGYEWTYEIENEDVIGLKDESYVTDDLEEEEVLIVGAPGTKKYIFEALEEGESTITFYYSRSWEDDEEPLYSLVYIVSVDENMNITQTFKSGIYSDEIPDLEFERIETPADDYED